MNKRKLAGVTSHAMGSERAKLKLLQNTRAQDSNGSGPDNEAVARYSVLYANRQLFAAKYVTCLPTEQELQRELERERRLIEARNVSRDTPPSSAGRSTRPPRPKGPRRSR